MTSGNRQRQTTHATTVQTPNVPDWITNGYQSYAQGIQDVASRDPSSFTTPANVNQQLAFQRAGNPSNSGGNSVQQGTDATAGLLGYTPQQVNVGQLANTDLSAYMNPFENDVVNNALSDIDRVRMGALTQNSADATRQNAWGGSRHGVVDTGTNDAALRAAASTSAGLRQSGYQNAQAAAFQDIMNRYNADAFNSQQGLAGQQFNLAAANQLAQLGLAGSANSRADTQLMADLGAQQRAIDAENNPNVAMLSLLQAYGGLLGQIPSSLFTGQTQTTDSSTIGRNSQGWLASLGQFLSSLGQINIGTSGSSGSSSGTGGGGG